jgi:small subunit ribosomal protein S1
MKSKTQESVAPLTGKMAELMEEIKNQKFPKMDELIKGTVINVGKNEVLLDINGITTGMVRGKELEDESGDHTDLKIGDEAYATVLDLENERGILELSFRQAGHQKAWEGLNELKGKGSIIKTKITDANKGGLMCKVGGVIGFMPVSQLTTEHYPRVEGGDKNKILEILKSYIGQDFEAKVIDVDEKENKLIVSERAAWEEQQKEIIGTYSVGQTVKGKITGVVDFGAFVEFGENMEGLVHISEIAWQRIDNPRDYIKVGDEVEAKIIEIEGSKISLSIKTLKTDPWKEVAGKYKIGQTLKGKVLKTNDFGAFVELDNDIHGLAHISELADYPIKTAQDVIKIGEEYEFKIVSIEPDEHRLGLSLKALKQKEEKPKTEKKEKKEKKEKPEPVEKKTNKE